MSTFYENTDLIRLADRVVKELYHNKDIYNYVHNGKQLPTKYEKIIERTICCSNIEKNKSLQAILTNAIRFSFNQNTKLNTTIANEYRMYREICERNKIILLSLQKKKNLGDTSLEIEIEKKEEEIKLLQKKIDEIANITNTKPEFNKNILSLAEEVYLLLLRVDKTPYYFYSEVCKKLGLRINLDQQFPGFRDANTFNQKKKEDDIENEDYKNFLDMNVKKGVYVPPALRKDNSEEKLNKLNKINKLNNTEEKNIKKEFNLQEGFPELNIQNIKDITQTKTNIWSKRPNILPDKIEENKIEENKIEENKPNKYVEKDIRKEVNVKEKEEYVFNTSWEDCGEY
jgi:hypothetical protein